MTEKRLDNSPVVYYISKCKSDNWVLFLHAAFVNHNMFKSQFEYFGDKFNIIAVDLIGHGKSTDVKKGDGIEKMSEWIYQVLLNEKVDGIHLVGISLGSVLTQDFANKYPEMVKSLACFGGYDINNFDVNMQKSNGLSQMLMMMKAIFSVKWFAKSNKKISAYTEKAQNEFFEMNIEFPKRSFMYLSTLNSMVNKQKTEKRTYPLMIGCGEYDIPMELAAVKMWKKNEPDCSLIIFKGAGHCVNMDVPETFNKEIERFWDKAIQSS